MKKQKERSKEIVATPLFNELKFPRGIPARLGMGALLTTMFDCTCDRHHCLTTTISTYLLKALDMVSAKFDQPITIVTAFNCQKPVFAKGEALQLQSSANDQLLAIWERLYPEYIYEQDEQTITIRRK